MRQLRYIDFDCSNCGNFETRFVYVETETGAPIEPELCSNPELFPADDAQPAGYCRAPLTSREINGIPPPITIVKGNSDYNERERERLEKRQDDHWRRQGRDEAVDRERALFKKHGMEGTGGVR